MNLIRLVVKLLRETADKLEAGTCSMSEQEALDVLSMLAHEAMSKDQACTYLNVSRATFDNYVKAGLIPPGIKRRGWKELCWYKDQLDSNIFKI